MGLGLNQGRGSLLAVAIAAGALATGCNDNDIAATGGDLRASPGFIDYGMVKEQTQFAQTVIITNEGGTAAEIRRVRVEPSDAPYEFTDEIPTEAAPWVVNKGDYRAIELAFAPVINGVRTGQLFIETSQGELVIDLTGHGYHTTLDDFEQGGTIGGKADILFVVDNSGSMSDKQTKLGNSFGTFINWLIGGEVDYRIAITTTDMTDPTHQGRFRAAAGQPLILDVNTPNIVDTFKANVNVGAAGSADERGLAAAAAALSPGLLAAENANFLRSDAKLYVVWVTDENDASPSNPPAYQSQIASAKGGDLSQVYFAAIAGPEPLGCGLFSLETADPGSRYIDIIDATGGLFGSICEADFGVTLQDLAFQVTANGGTFPLSEIPDPTTIQVLVDGIPVATTTWTYLVNQNAIQFVSGFEPTGGAAVTVSYDVL